MLKITCKDEFFNSVINKLLLQKNLINDIDMDKFFVIIEIDIRENYLNLNCNGKKEHLSMPININSLYSQIQRIISDIKISKDEYDYYPYQKYY